MSTIEVVVSDAESSSLAQPNDLLYRLVSELGFKPHGCYREGICDYCLATRTVWYWRKNWCCEVCVFQSLQPDELLLEVRV